MIRGKKIKKNKKIEVTIKQTKTKCLCVTKKLQSAKTIQELNCEKTINKGTNKILIEQKIKWVSEWASQCQSYCPAVESNLEILLLSRWFRKKEKV